MNWGEFFNMGGYAFNVWGSYLLATVILGLNFWLPLRTFRARQKKIRHANETSSQKN